MQTMWCESDMIPHNETVKLHKFFRRLCVWVQPCRKIINMKSMWTRIHKSTKYGPYGQIKCRKIKSITRGEIRFYQKGAPIQKGAPYYYLANFFQKMHQNEEIALVTRACVPAPLVSVTDCHLSQGKRHQKSKTSITVAPQKGPMSSRNWTKSRLLFTTLDLPLCIFIDCNYSRHKRSLLFHILVISTCIIQIEKGRGHETLAIRERSFLWLVTAFQCFALDKRTVSS